MKNIQNWNEFVVEFSEKILPLYEEHELTFDKYQIHGRLHIARSIIFAEYMGRFNLIIQKNNVDLHKIRYAVAFHDSGRKGNGVDIWENDSAETCYNYLLEKNINKKYARETANLIIKSMPSSELHKIIVTDADVLEIMRPVCGHGGISGFNPNYFNFLKYRNMVERNEIIKEAWSLILATENIIKNDHLNKVLEIIENDVDTYKLFNSF